MRPRSEAGSDAGTARGIGSVIPTPDIDRTRVEASTVWSTWTSNAADARAFSSGRAALAALLLQRSIRRLWLPAYCCRALIEGVRAACVEPVWYGVDERLNADLGTIHAGLQPGDAVLAIAWFGRLPEEGFRNLVCTWPDILFIEDRAQALDPAGGIEGAVRLYSPRKLLGVADGGILVGNDLPDHPTEPGLVGLWSANDARAADPNGHAPENWFPAFQNREEAFDTEARPCSPRTLDLLRRIDCRREAEVRRQNWRALAGTLDRLALWSIPDPGFAPLAFPIIVSDAKAFVARLAEHRIWAARHWADLPCPASFRAAHQLSHGCVSLPLDGRYGLADMQRIATVVLDLAADQSAQAVAR